MTRAAGATITIPFSMERQAFPQPAISARPWRRAEPPARILAIRMQAMGDVVITLPYLRALQRLLPDTVIDFVTRFEHRDIPRAVRLFRHVDGLGGGPSE